MSTNLIIGNCISLIAAYFTARSSWVKDTWNIYMFQVGQCLLLALASVFFNSYAGIVTLLVCAFRNFLAANEKLDQKWMLVCLVVILAFGIVLNNRGWIGWIIIVANGLYTFGMYVAKKELWIKCNMILNLILWMIYEVLVMDIPSFTADGVGLVVAVASLHRKKGKTEQKCEDRKE